jgi:putative endonuclease
MRLWPAPREDRAGIWRRGERAAAGVMRRAGCRVVARNLRLRDGEIDLLCEERRGGRFVLVEVKARLVTGDGFRPEDAVTHAKQAKLLTLARALMREERVRSRGLRIDVVAVEFRPGQRRPAAVRHHPSCVTA